MDCKKFYKSLTEEQRAYLEETLNTLVEVAHDFYDEWDEYEYENDFWNFRRVVADAMLLCDVTGVSTDEFWGLLKSDRTMFIKKRKFFNFMMVNRINRGEEMNCQEETETHE